MHLQSMNNPANVHEVAKYLTPEMFAAVKAEVSANSETADFPTLNCDLLDAVEENGRYIASVRFHGMVSESVNARWRRSRKSGITSRGRIPTTNGWWRAFSRKADPRSAQQTKARQCAGFLLNASAYKTMHNDAAHWHGVPTMSQMAHHACRLGLALHLLYNCVQRHHAGNRNIVTIGIADRKPRCRQPANPRSPHPEHHERTPCPPACLCRPRAGRAGVQLTLSAHLQSGPPSPDRCGRLVARAGHPGSPRATAGAVQPACATGQRAALDRHARALHVAHYARLGLANSWLFLNADAEGFLLDGEAVENFPGWLAAHGLRPDQVVLEVLEHRIDDLDTLVAALRQLKRQAA